MGGAVSLISSATKLAALVGLVVGLDLLSPEEAEDASDHAWRKGDGLTGAVALVGVRRREEGNGVVWRKTPFVRGVEGTLGNGTRSVADGLKVEGWPFEESPTFRRLLSWPGSVNGPPFS